MLVHLLQNERLPKNSRKFVEELRKVRNQRWLVSRVCMLQNQDMKCALGHLKTLNEPKIRETKIKELEMYSQFIKTL